MHLGIQAVIAKSFARIHLSNLINYGIVPLVFTNPDDYDSLDQNDWLKFKKLKQAIRKGQAIKVVNQTKHKRTALKALVSTDKIEMLLAGGLLPYIKKTIKKPGK
jgi:aconitate hydratase